MPKYFFGRAVVVLLFSIVFCCGLAALRSGEIRPRGPLFNRDDNPLGYWFTAIISLVGTEGPMRSNSTSHIPQYNDRTAWRAMQ